MYVTLGLFTIVQIVRNVQMLIPAYDFCIPEKECTTTSDNPCEMFRRIEFPTDEFFPPKVGTAAAKTTSISKTAANNARQKKEPCFMAEEHKEVLEKY